MVILKSQSKKAGHLAVSDVVDSQKSKEMSLASVSRPLIDLLAEVRFSSDSCLLKSS